MKNYILRSYEQALNYLNYLQGLVLGLLNDNNTLSFHEYMDIGKKFKYLYDILRSSIDEGSSITWVTGADEAKIAFKDVPIWKVTKICEILGEPQDSEYKEGD